MAETNDALFRKRLLALEPENFAWLTSGATPRGILDPSELPVVYYSAEQRWIIAGNPDSQRLFDEEVDGLGFQLKEWPWHWGREQLLTDLCQGRRLVSDRPLPQAKCKTGNASATRAAGESFVRAFACQCTDPGRQESNQRADDALGARPWPRCGRRALEAGGGPHRPEKR